MEPFKPGDKVEVRFFELRPTPRRTYEKVDTWLPATVVLIDEPKVQVRYPSGLSDMVASGRLRRPSTPTTEAQP